MYHLKFNVNKNWSFEAIVRIVKVKLLFYSFRIQTSIFIDFHLLKRKVDEKWKDNIKLFDWMIDIQYLFKIVQN